MINDARRDVRFHDNPLETGEPHIIFYAGVPLISKAGLPLGTLCVIDDKPNKLNKNQRTSLSALANQVKHLFELRKNKMVLDEMISDLETRNKKLEQFVLLAAHDINSPLIGISSMTKLFLRYYSANIDKEGREMFELVEGSANKLKSLIDGLLEYSRSDSVLKETKSIIDLEVLITEITDLHDFEKKLIVKLKTDLKEVFTIKTVVNHILINLVTNAIKYNDKEKTEIEIGLTEDNYSYT